MTSLLLAHIDSLSAGKYLAVLPIAGLQLESAFNLGGYSFYPAGACDMSELRTVPNQRLQPSYEGQALREVKTSATGVSLEHLQKNALVSFCVDLDWDAFLDADYAADLRLIRTLSQAAERAMDRVKFDFCRFDLPETLPSYVGSWELGNGLSAAVLYTLKDNESYLIAGAAFSTFVGSYGLGLELDAAQIAMVEHAPLPSADDGETGGIAQHGLTLFSEVLAAPNPTVKFVRTMTLLEFLATPDSYEKWKKAKQNIICHIARSKTEYHTLAARFEELTSQKDSTGSQIGYRTLLVHHGRFLESILDDHGMTNLFRELQRYGGSVIDEMIAHRTDTWADFSKHRTRLKEQLGI